MCDCTKTKDQIFRRMVSKKHPLCLLNKRPHARTRTAIALCAGLIYSALPVVVMLNFVPVSQAFAQLTKAEDEALFLAVENNNLDGVRKAVASGASIDARDFNGMQPVDLAIDRGFFDIAHFLISKRNASASDPQQSTLDANIGPDTATTDPMAEPTVVETPQAPETPVAQELDVTPPQEPEAAPDVVVAQEPDVAVQETVQKPKPTQANAQTQTFNEVKRLDTKKTTATRKFFSTFMDFFKPANTTGIMRKERKKDAPTTDILTPNELNAQLQELEAELGPALQVTSPVLKPSEADAKRRNERIAKARAAKKPPTSSSEQSAKAGGADPFGDFKSTDSATPDTSASPSIAPKLANGKPFGGGVDPDILAMLDGTYTDPAMAALSTPESTAQNDPFAPLGADAPPASDPFAMDQPQDVAVLKAKSPPSRATPPAADPFAAPAPAAADPFAAPAAADPFAAPEAADPFAAPAAGTTDVLAGLLDTTDGSKSPSGWDVKAVEGATIPNEVQLLSTIEPTGTTLEGVELALGAGTVVGQEIDENRLTLMKEDTIHKPCLIKGGPETMFCVDKVSWPFELEEDFLVDTIMYQGTSTVSRYDAGRATNFHALFKSISFARVIDYYINRYGQPSEIVQRAVAPLAKPRMDNPTYIWRNREAGTDTTTTLEIRKFDDEGGSFPDTRRGLIKLYRSHAGPIFPQLSQLELMVLKANGSVDTFAAPKPESVW